MDAMLVQYGLFVLIALILVGSVIALNKHLTRQSRSSAIILKTWAKLDTRHMDTREQNAAAFDEEDMQIHAHHKQNGHHAEEQKR